MEYKYNIKILVANFNHSNCLKDWKSFLNQIQKSKPIKINKTM